MKQRKGLSNAFQFFQWFLLLRAERRKIWELQEMLGQPSNWQFSLVLLAQIECKGRARTILVYNISYAETSCIKCLYTSLKCLFTCYEVDRIEISVLVAVPKLTVNDLGLPGKILTTWAWIMWRTWLLNWTVAVRSLETLFSSRRRWKLPCWNWRLDLE